jgi:hypothetical protein
VSVRWLCNLALLATAAFSCTRVNPGRCDRQSDCTIGTCNPSTKVCELDGGVGGSGGSGGAAGSTSGTGGTLFTCSNAKCSGTKPICDVDAGGCRACNVEKTAACGSLNGGTPRCVPGDAGPLAGMCVGCLTNSDCTTPQAPICNTSAGMCQPCADSNACATKDSTKPVCVTTATTTLMKGMCVGCLMDTHCTTPQTPICSLDTGTCEGCDAAGTNACTTKDTNKPVCVKTATGGLAKGTCVGCLMNSDCNGAPPSTPICKSNSCAGCTADTDCSGMGAGICVKDGHCATIAETIYVKNDTASCTDAPSVSANAGTSAQPFCTMQPVTMYLSPARDLVIVSGLVSGATWSYNDNVTGGLLSIVGQLGAQIASSASPGFSLQGGNVYIRGVSFSPSGSIGIKSTGGAITLYGVTVDGCMGGGIFLSGTTFDIENTTVTNNGPGAQGTSGGVNISTAGAGSKLNLVTIENNKQIGITCDTAIAATGVLVMSNTGGDIANSCKFSSCSMGAGCGAP